MDSLEVSAKTVDEAIERGLQQLGLTREQVEIVVLNKGRLGFLGMGAEDAVVKLTPLLEPTRKESDLPSAAKAALEEILRRMNVEARVELRTDVQQDEGESSVTPIALDVSGEDLGILIGRRGETLAALQYILRLIVAHQQKARVPLTVDVEGYKQRRYKSLRELALRMAQQAVSTRQSRTLEPMPADERRVVHLALSVNPDVVTQSIGEGELRKVVIMPRKR
ncbi:MAG: RNA-binding cell elongation regulator Jag/EloR [Dehalococcoidia bacterium]|nr:RNA-binding cell elongation regulator Jag/EloR [Dehalococcoidia bacterium]